VSLILVLGGPFAATDGSVLLRFLRGDRSFILRWIGTENCKKRALWEICGGRLHIYAINSSSRSFRTSI
jgi:hypothetical protein